MTPHLPVHPGQQLTPKVLIPKYHPTPHRIPSGWSGVVALRFLPFNSRRPCRTVFGSCISPKADPLAATSVAAARCKIPHSCSGSIGAVAPSPSRFGLRWIQMHVVTSRSQVAVAARPLATLYISSAKQVPHHPVPTVKTARCKFPKPLHAIDQVRFRRLHHRMEVISSSLRMRTCQASLSHTSLRSSRNFRRSWSSTKIVPVDFL